jgi:predicted Zn-dependent protease
MHHAGLSNTSLSPARLLVLLLATAIAWHPLSAQEGVRLPDLGGAGDVLSPEEARTFPNEFRNYMRSMNALVDDPVIESYFTEMGYSLVMHSDARARDFHFHVLRVPGINAFAAPAGVVALNAGLVLAAETADEVAGVVAHEIAHVTQDHLARGAQEARRVSMPMMLATLGLVMAGGIAGGLDGEAAQGLLATGMGLSEQTRINYTRQNEAEADRIGIQLMARAGYDPNGMVDFFDTLNQWVRTQGAGPPEYLRTHPMPVSRVAEARQRAGNFPRQARPADSRFAFVRARLRVLMSEHPDEAIAYFDARLEQADEQEEAPLRYGLALALVEARRAGRAEQEVAWLLEREPDSQLFRLLRGDLLLSQGRFDAALAVFEGLYRDYGQSTPVALAYADALLRADDPARAERATELLQQQLRRNPHDVRVSERLAHAADRAGDSVRAAEAVATNYYQRGGLQQAIDQLERVLERDDLDYYARARISAKLDRLRVERLRSMREHGMRDDSRGRLSRDRQTAVMNQSHGGG